MSPVSAYFFLAAMASACSILILILSSRTIRNTSSINARSLYKMVRFIGVLFILSPLLYFAFPTEQLTLVSSQGIVNVDDAVPTSIPYTIELMQTASKQGNLPSLPIFSVLFALGFLSFFIKYCIDQIRIRRVLTDSYLLKCIGRVRILLSDSTGVPFAYRDLKHSFVIIPNDMARNYSHFALAIKHEIQHHRQGDTSWSHFSFFLRALFFWNPLVHLAVARISELQELACDEALVARGEIDSGKYCDCLIAVAESTLVPRKVLVGTTGMAQGTSLHKLTWRIEMIRRKNFSASRWLHAIAAIVSIAFVTSTAIAASDILRDKQITLIEAENLVRESIDSDFPVEVNAAVLEQLNYFIGTSTGRDFIRDSLGRQGQYDEVLQTKFALYNAPDELLAVALMESGFSNSAQNTDAYRSAGVWQFTPGTARAFGLQIDDAVDERLDVELATDAALRLLQTLNNRFGDWRLALLGYNAGRGIVQRGIDNTGSSDPWRLIDAGYNGDPDYLAKMMAGVLILKNPTLID